MTREKPSASVVVDLVAGSLSIDGQPLALRPKTWEVLRQLVAKPDELVRKDELLDAVWPDTAISEGTLNKSIGELRAALEERLPGRSFVQTVPRRGFRWVGEATVIHDRAQRDERNAPAVSVPSPAPAAEARPEPPRSADVVARSAHLAELEACLAKARSGRHQVVFLTGEAGAGKTTVLDAFLDRVEELARAGRDAGAAPLIVAHGQCIDTSGHHEAYGPVFEALERVVRGIDSPLPAILKRFAPTWAAQMPILSEAGAIAAAPGAIVPGRMLRELTMAVEEVTAHATLLVVLEDAQWADLATTDLFAALSRRRDPSRLMMVATVRVAEATVLAHPVAAMALEMVARGEASRLEMEPFDRDEISDYLAQRCRGLETGAGLVEWLLVQTAGNPLFVRLAVEDWIARGLVARGDDGAWRIAGDAEELRSGVPDNLRSLLESQLAQLTAEQRKVLDAASVRIGEFDAPSIARAIGVEVEDVEATCQDIVRRGRFLKSGERAAITPTGIHETFAFVHATVQKVVSDGLTPARRRRLHLAAAEDLEREYAGRTEPVAAQLAVHFEAGGDRVRAMRSLREVARLALRRDSPRDAVAILERVLAIAEIAEGVDGRDDERLLATSALSHARQVAFGFVDPEVAKLWSRTSQLAVTRENAVERMRADSGRIMVCCVTARYAEAEQAIREALPLLDVVDDLGVRQTLFFSSATVRYRIAAMDDARLLFESALALTSSTDPVPGADFPALLMSQYAPVMALVGRPDEARRLVKESVARAQAHGRYSECVTATLAAWSLALLHDFAGAAPIAQPALEIAEADQYATWATRPLALLGLHAMREGRVDEGVDMVQRGLGGRRRDGQMVDHSALCCLFAEALMDAGRSEEAAAVLREGREFAAESGERFYDCEFHRLHAKMQRLAGAPAEEVEAELRRAIELASQLGVHWHRLLAARDLASLLVDEGRPDEARAALDPALALVDGGAGLAAVDAATALLAKVSAAK